MELSSLKTLLSKAKSKEGKNRIAIAAAEDISVVKAALQAYKLGLIAPIFIGRSKKILNILEQAGSPKGTTHEIISAHTATQAAAKAVELLLSGKADMLMKGLVSTSLLLHEVVHKKRGIAGSGLLSHFGIFQIPGFNRLLALTDPAMNIAPDKDQKIQIILNAVKALHKLGTVEPRVALLAAIEKVNPKMQATVDAEEITNLHQQNPLAKCLINGPLALDGAVSAEASKLKGITNEVAGQADLLVVPDIESGNILYKSLIYLARAETAGVILGAKKPIILTSRADSEKSKLYSIALATCLA